MTRTVIEIDEELCDGCGLCITGCHEGALQIIDGKARLVGESLCDGLGACLGECPRGALKTVERQAEEYSERKVIEHILGKGMNTVIAHLRHLKDHGQDIWYNEAIETLAQKDIDIASLERELAPVQFEACPAAIKMGAFGAASGSAAKTQKVAEVSPAGTSLNSRLEQWPVQLHLINPRASYFQSSDVLLAADCTAYACGSFHQSLLAGRKLLIACPKLDSGKDIYIDKIRILIDEANLRSVTLAVMDVPCCNGLRRILDDALNSAGRRVPVYTAVVSASGGSITWL